MRTKTREITALGGGRPLQSLAHSGIPQRSATAVRPDEDPLVRVRAIRGRFSAVAVDQVSQGERSLARFRLRIVYIPAPVALYDLDNAVQEVYVPPFQPEQFRDARAGGDCGFE